MDARCISSEYLTDSSVSFRLVLEIAEQEEFQRVKLNGQRELIADAVTKSYRYSVDIEGNPAIPR